MSHTQPSPTAGVAHHPHMAAHPQVNGHMPAAIPAQAPKGVSLTTAQKIAALNEQVWLQIGMFLLFQTLNCARLRTDWITVRQLNRVDGRPGWLYECVRASASS